MNKQKRRSRYPRITVNNKYTSTTKKKRRRKNKKENDICFNNKLKQGLSAGYMYIDHNNIERGPQTDIQNVSREGSKSWAIPMRETAQGDMPESRSCNASRKRKRNKHTSPQRSRRETDNLRPPEGEQRVLMGAKRAARGDRAKTLGN